MSNAINLLRNIEKIKYIDLQNSEQYLNFQKEIADSYFQINFYPENKENTIKLNLQLYNHVPLPKTTT